MTQQVKVLVVTGNGTNCERESAHAFRVAGADQVDVAMIWDLLAGDVRLAPYQVLCLPGGFMDGDDLGAGKAAAIRWRFAAVAGGESRLVDQLKAFLEAGKLVIGICNGFQLMAKLGLVPAVGEGKAKGIGFPKASLSVNDSGRFEDRWVRLRVDPASPCVFTRGIELLDVPCRHGEGKVVFASPEVAAAVEAGHLAPVRYVDLATNAPTEAYPLNPNGSPGGIAGLCDPTGRVFGLMPHPEAFHHRTNHPHWTRRSDLPEEGLGIAVFRNAVSFVRTGG
jgi:phosphoribosylformylglycinamidine synthase